MVTKITIMNMKTKLFFFLALVLTWVGTEKMNAQNTFVDLGLPSGTLWATCNVGASSPEENGKYFAWGETSDKSTYAWSSYKYGTSERAMTKYCTDKEYGINGFKDGLTELLPEDDTATANWGKEWQMPSDAQFEELFNSNYTTLAWTTLNGKRGAMITSNSNGHSIFLPATGFKKDNTENEVGDWGDYWSRSIDNIDPKYGKYGDLRLEETHSHHRFVGLCVRPVRVQEPHTLSDIPDGWKVNGTTTSGTYQAKGGDVLHFTPKNIPAGKRVKSIKVVKK